MMNTHVPDVKKIAVLRANALGDFIFVLPALRALRETYPHAEIVLLGKTWHQTFVPGRVDTVDRVIAVPPCEGVGEEPGTLVDEEVIADFFEEMRRERFDLAIQLHGGGRYSNPFVSRLGARLTVGLRAEDAPALDRTVPYVYYQNEILRYLEAVSLIGAKTAEISPHIRVTAEDVKEAAAVAEAAGGRPFLVMHPGASDPRRRWPRESFAAVATHFLNAGLAVFVTGTEGEAELVDAVTECTAGRAMGLAGKLSLGGLAALCQGAAVIISNDTGPLHLAEAVGARTVGIYWCGNLINAGPITRATHRPLLSWMLECADCTREHRGDYPFSEGSCPHQSSFVSEISVEECITACQTLVVP